ncbi:MAG: YncE family protein, partial [Methylocystis sp.]
MKLWRLPSPVYGRRWPGEAGSDEGPHPSRVPRDTLSRKRERGGASISIIAFALLSSPALADEAFVTAQGADALSIVDLSKMQTVATLPIGGKPAGVAVSRDGARAFITSPEG